ncbi:MAG: hypothetical protein MUP81_01405 [Dehalococcoidia bacterium]|nr:hypothetical protein [Dehalococcoidia bacterium]
MEDLIYAGEDIEALIKTKYPTAKITDASDEIHTERFELDIPDIDDDEFYPFAIKEGFAMCCLSLALLLESLKFPETKTIKPKENKAKIERWIAMSVAGNESPELLKDKP